MTRAGAVFGEAPAAPAQRGAVGTPPSGFAAIKFVGTCSGRSAAGPASMLWTIRVTPLIGSMRLGAGQK